MKHTLTKAVVILGLVAVGVWLIARSGALMLRALDIIFSLMGLVLGFPVLLV